MTNSLQLYQQSSKDISLLDPRDFVPLWLENLKTREQAQELSADTVHSYRVGAEKFLTWLKASPTPDAIRRWKAALLTHEYKPATVNAWLAGVRSFFGWLAETQQIPFNPAAQIKGAGRKGAATRHVRQSLTDEEVRRLLECPDRTTTIGRRDYAMLMIMLYTSARGIELHRADTDDLSTEHGKLVLLVQGKGHREKDDILVFNADVESAVRDWIAVRGQVEGALFTSFSHRSTGARLSIRSLHWIVKHYFKLSGITGRNKTTHSTRHTAITSAIKHGAPLQKVKGMTRHVSMDTLMIYFHEVDREVDPAEEYISYDGK